MNKQQKLALARRYFIKQKVKEITLFLLIVSAIIFIPYFLGHYIGDNKFCYSTIGGGISEDLDNCYGTEYKLVNMGRIAQWGEGIIYSLVIFLTFMLLLTLGKIIGDWIEDNWERAKQRAGLK